MSAELRADPAVLSATCQSLSGAAQHLLERLRGLDGNVTSMLAGWQGTSGGSYGDAWKLWHAGRVLASGLVTQSTGRGAVDSRLY